MTILTGTIIYNGNRKIEKRTRTRTYKLSRYTAWIFGNCLRHSCFGDIQ